MSSRRELPPFSGDGPRCIKCGNVGAHTGWKPAEKLGSNVLRREWLRRRCARCGYGWDEAVITSAQESADE